MVELDQAWLLPAIPLISFLALSAIYLALKDKAEPLSGYLGTTVMAINFVVFLFVAFDLMDQLPAGPGELVNNVSGFTWLAIEEIDFELRIAFLVDQLSLVMVGVVSFVALMVHAYSIGYMKGEPRYGWYYSVLALFVASMLALVLTDNFLLLYITWEGVGICSFLLIGHYYDRRSAAEAAKKAFITTRLGDVAMLIGIIMLWRGAESFEMSEIFHHAEEGGYGATYLTAATLFLFGGAVGKSAQFPLHVWLPDAMEGPTPVSALIHAATMVVAGVYLVARAEPLFAHADYAAEVVIVVGLITTFMSAFMGLVMDDIKRVVAYSTLNSLGLMMVALGVGSPGAAMLYLFAHAFFKALLFLGSGSVIHATHKQDLPSLGGLAKKMPITNATFLIGVLCMAGMVPLSGFWAKDEILVVAQDYSPVVLIALLATLPITAMYMIRVYLLTFQGEPRDHHAWEHAHESPPIMSWPLIILGVLAVVSGFVVIDSVGEAIGLESGFLGFVENVFEAELHHFHFDVPMAIISTVLVGAGLVAGWYFWSGEAAPAKAAGARFPAVYQLLFNKFYIDDIYQWAINNVVLGFGKVIAFLDRAIVNDTGINGPGHVALGVGWLGRMSQTGKLPNYALGMALGVTVLAIVGLSVKG